MQGYAIGPIIVMTPTQPLSPEVDVPVRRTASVTLLAAAALLAVSAAPVAAARPTSDYQNPVVNWVQPTVIAQADGTATVHAQYTCYGGNEGTHVYIGVKQGPLVNATDHTSSQYAETFYSTNWNSDSGVNALHCDGHKHNQTFVLQPDPYWAGAAGAPLLSSGIAFVQFCVFDSHNTGETDPTGFAFDYSMRKVVED